MLLNKKKGPALLLSLASLLCLASGMSLHAQDWRGGDKGGPGGDGPGAPPMERAFHGMEHGRWWDNPRVSQQLGLTDDQKKKMDDIFQEHLLQLIDLNAALEKQEAIMRPLVSADQPDETKILNQIDVIAQARANLEKNRARMLFGIRQVLTPDQWKKVQAFVRQGPPGMDRGRDGRDGRGPGWGPRKGGPDGGGMPKGPQPPPANGAPAPPSE
jgi:Spy/CpxP family protein refolding chaperone